MPLKNYRSTRAKYLGVPISIKVDPLQDWKPTLDKFEKVCRTIRDTRATVENRIRLINTYALPVLEYVSRFRIMNNLVANRVLKALRIAMGGNSLTPLQPFMTGYDLVGLSTKLQHPILWNWALLSTKKTRKTYYQNPSSV